MSGAPIVSGLLRGLPPSIAGYHIVESRYLYRTEFRQYRFPRSKKRRIRNKWTKQSKNFKNVMHPLCGIVGDTIYAHPLIVDAIRRQFAK